MTQALNLKFLLDRSIAYHRPFVGLGAGVTGAVMLSQAIYWSGRTKNAQGWFYKTQGEWTDETGLSRREQEGVRKKFRTKGILEETRKGVPARLHFRVNYDRLIEELKLLSTTVNGAKKDAPNRHTRMAQTAKQDATKPPYKTGANRHTNTETTSETTSENTHTHSKKSREADIGGEAGESVCVSSGFMKLNKDQQRVVDQFINPLARSLTLTKRHSSEMLTDMATDLIGYSSAVFDLAIPKLRGSRSVFPSIAQAKEVFKEVGPRAFKQHQIEKGSPEWEVWWHWAERSGTGYLLKSMARADRIAVDGNLLADLMAMEGKTCSSSEQPAALAVREGRA